jgi:hypothetical protein
MATTTLTRAHHLSYPKTRTKGSIVQRFLSWCDTQEENRLMWLAFALTAHGCVLTPLSFLAVAISGINMVMVILVMASIALTVVPNLAAQSTRVTIPLFFLSVLIDIAVVIACVFSGFNSVNLF